MKEIKSSILIIKKNCVLKNKQWRPKKGIWGGDMKPETSLDHQCLMKKRNALLYLV